MPNGDIGASIILLDVFCLEVKDAYFKNLFLPSYQQARDALKQKENLQPISPACARKLIEKCVDYAKNIGIEPHPDYKKAKAIFGEINPEDCSEEFVFGKDGKPFYMNGPNDTPKESKKIIDKLTETCGPEGFHHLLRIDSFL